MESVNEVQGGEELVRQDLRWGRSLTNERACEREALNTCEREHVCVGVCVRAHVSERGRVYMCVNMSACWVWGLRFWAEGRLRLLK